MYTLVGLSFLIVAALVGVSRSIYHLIGPKLSGSDAYGHWVQIRAFRRNGFRIPDKIPQSIYNMEFANPYLLPLSVAVIPERWWPTVNRYFSALMDIALLAVLAATSALGLLNGREFAVAAILLLLTPQLMRRDLAHGKAISARKLGQVLTTLSLLAFSYWIIAGGVPAFVLAALFGALVPITSRFSTQAFAFLCAGLAITVNPAAALLFATAIVASIVLSMGFAWTILSSHVRFMHEYAVRKQYTYLFDGLKSVDTIRSLLSVRNVWDLLETIYESILPFSLLNNPHVVASLAALGLAASTGTGLDVPFVFVAWILAGVAAFLLTSLYHLRFLGQPERYLEHIILPSVVICGKGSSLLGPTYVLILAASGTVGLAMLVGFVYMHVEVFGSGQNIAMEETVDYLKTLDKSVVLTQPRHHGARIAWETDHRVSDHLGNRYTSQASKEQYERLYPRREMFITNDITWLREEFDPDIILFDNSCEFSKGELSPPDSNPLFGNDRYEVYTFDQAR